MYSCPCQAKMPDISGRASEYSVVSSNASRACTCACACACACSCVCACVCVLVYGSLTSEGCFVVEQQWLLLMQGGNGSNLSSTAGTGKDDGVLGTCLDTVLDRTSRKPWVAKHTSRADAKQSIIPPIALLVCWLLVAGRWSLVIGTFKQPTVRTRNQPSTVVLAKHTNLTNAPWLKSGVCPVTASVNVDRYRHPHGAPAAARCRIAASGAGRFCVCCTCSFPCACPGPCRGQRCIARGPSRMRRVPGRVLAGPGVSNGGRRVSHVRVLLHVLRALRPSQSNRRRRKNMAHLGVVCSN